ncbi:MAG: alpha/beta hydrolase-fold protein, partial [Gaiellaceae bacterium]
GESDPEYVDHGPGDRWATAIATELPRVVDSRFRTIRSRTGRALIGISAGGDGAMQLGLNHLAEFSVVESWSGYFHPTDEIPTVRGTLHATKTFIAFYVGRSDWRFYAENETFNQELSEEGVAHVFRAYPGGHNQALWQRYAAPWLELALVHLAPAH